MKAFGKLSESTAIGFLWLARGCLVDRIGPETWEDLMTIELNEDEPRLLYAVVIEKAQEHSSYANTSEVADRLCKLARRIHHQREALLAAN